VLQAGFRHLAPLTIRATSCMRARSSTADLLFGAAVSLALFNDKVLIGKRGDLRQVGYAEKPAGRGSDS